MRAGWEDLAAIGRELRERRREAEQEEARRRAQDMARQREQELFSRSVGPVTPLPVRDLACLQRPRPAPIPRMRQLDEAQVLRSSLSDDFDPVTLMETDDRLAYHRSGVGPDVLKDLRQGRWTVQGQIDLHGLRRDAAREALGNFLAEAARQGWRCVRVVHGKGHGSPGKRPVLKGKVQRWLAQSAEVIAFARAGACAQGQGGQLAGPAPRCAGLHPGARARWWGGGADRLAGGAFTPAEASAPLAGRERLNAGLSRQG